MAGKMVVGLIGGMGSGKSRVAAELARRGGFIISGDALGHEALRQPEIRGRIIERWGRNILDPGGEIDRRRLGAIVFAETNDRRALEALVFPYIERRIEEELASARKDPRVNLIVLDAAVMVEAGWDRFCDRLVFVDAPRPARLSRLARERGWQEREILARENAQEPLEEKIRRADFVIDNSGPLDRLSSEVDNLLAQWGIGKELSGVSPNVC